MDVPTLRAEVQYFLDNDADLRNTNLAEQQYYVKKHVLPWADPNYSKASPEQQQQYLDAVMPVLQATKVEQPPVEQQQAPIQNNRSFLGQAFDQALQTGSLGFVDTPAPTNPIAGFLGGAAGAAVPVGAAVLAAPWLGIGAATAGVLGATVGGLGNSVRDQLDEDRPLTFGRTAVDTLAAGGGQFLGGKYGVNFLKDALINAVTNVGQEAAVTGINQEDQSWQRLLSAAGIGVGGSGAFRGLGKIGEIVSTVAKQAEPDTPIGLRDLQRRADAEQQANKAVEKVAPKVDEETGRPTIQANAQKTAFDNLDFMAKNAIKTVVTTANNTNSTGSVLRQAKGEQEKLVRSLVRLDKAGKRNTKAYKDQAKARDFLQGIIDNQGRIPAPPKPVKGLLPATAETTKRQETERAAKVRQQLAERKATRQSSAKQRLGQQLPSGKKPIKVGTKAIGRGPEGRFGPSERVKQQAQADKFNKQLDARIEQIRGMQDPDVKLTAAKKLQKQLVDVAVKGDGNTLADKALPKAKRLVAEATSAKSTSKAKTDTKTKPVDKPVEVAPSKAEPKGTPAKQLPTKVKPVEPVDAPAETPKAKFVPQATNEGRLGTRYTTPDPNMTVRKQKNGNWVVETKQPDGTYGDGVRVADQETARAYVAKAKVFKDAKAVAEKVAGPVDGADYTKNLQKLDTLKAFIPKGKANLLKTIAKAQGKQLEVEYVAEKVGTTEGKPQIEKGLEIVYDVSINPKTANLLLETVDANGQLRTRIVDEGQHGFRVRGGVFAKKAPSDFGSELLSAKPNDNAPSYRVEYASNDKGELVAQVRDTEGNVVVQGPAKKSTPLSEWLTERLSKKGALTEADHKRIANEIALVRDPEAKKVLAKLPAKDRTAVNKLIRGIRCNK